MNARARLGEVLLRREALPREKLEAALSEQNTSGARLGDILTSRGDVTRLALYQAVAEHHTLPFANLLNNPPDRALLDPAHADDYVRLNVIPWKWENGTTHLAAVEPNEATVAWLEEHYGKNYTLHVTSPYDIRKVLEKCFGAHFEHESRLRLFNASPMQSARSRMSYPQRIGFTALGCMAVLALAFFPHATTVALLVALNVMYGVVMLFKWGVFVHGKRGPDAAGNILPLVADRDLPVYTVLVPLYREAESLPYIIRSLERLDYPTAKLDVKLVLEEDDVETYRAALALKPGWHFDIVRVPPSEPRTKPKACNYALRFARGTYVTIYDAEDEPHPMQLKAAIAAFRYLPTQTACLQARLNYYNAGDNMLTRWFAIEYAILFDRLLPGLERAHIPIPLGGTSNHLSLARLRALGEWDPYNVTEDADLGIRLAVGGYKTAVLDSLTLEEAPAQLGPWLRQRSRWIKGYMQTWLVHMRAPMKLYKKSGARGFAGFQLFVGCSSVAYMSAPFVWVFALLAWAMPGAMAGFTLPAWFPALCLLNLALHLFAHWHQAFSVLRGLPGIDKTPRRFFAAAALFPFYWVLHSIASYKALWQLICRPHFWEKTSHFASKREQIHMDNTKRVA